MATTTEPNASASSGPWWRFPLMWLVLGGPAAVVVAGIATVVIASQGADPIVDPDYYRTGVQINEQLRTRASSHAPAHAARNHVVTPVHDRPDLAPQ